MEGRGLREISGKGSGISKDNEAMEILACLVNQVGGEARARNGYREFIGGLILQ